MLNNIDKLKELHAKAIAEAEHANALADAAPVMPKSVNFASTTMPWIGYDVDTLEQALEVYRQYMPEPWVLARGTFTTLLPMEELERKNYKYDTLNETEGAPYFECHGGFGFNNTELEFFSKVKGRLVKVCVRIKNSPVRSYVSLRNPNAQPSRNNTAKVHARVPGGDTIQWGFGDESVRTTVWFQTLYDFDTAMEGLAVKGTGAA